MKNKFILISAAFAAMLLSQGNASAQRQEYAYPHSIDLQTGYSASLIKVPGDAGNAHGMADGSLINFRYTGYMTPHFGVFGEIGFYNSFLNSERYYGIVNRADGHKYLYKDDYNYHPYYSNYSPILKVGLASRLDCGQFSFRPRLGIGVAGFRAHDLGYDRFDRKTNNEEHVYISSYDSAKDYLVGASYDRRTPSLVLSGSLQATYTFYRHFYVSAEAGIDLMPKQFICERTVNDVVYAKEPGAGIYEDDRRELVNPRTTTTSLSVPDLLTVKLG
ncbi:MAG: hypothetical protein MJZ16_14000, partial [Bacteroidales bacterium]|nr:hypothetical protein [Bacteroidales bacterium]